MCGLGDADKCTEVKNNLAERGLGVLCLQETKLTAPSTFEASTFLPPNVSSFIALDAVGASGGIITACDRRSVALYRSMPLHFSLTCFFSATVDALFFTVTNVFAPCDAASRPAFFAELVSLTPQCSCPWLVLGDFNVARAPEDKNNDHFNVSAAELFNDTINDLLLQELTLLDRRFTWSNKHRP